MFVDQLVFSPLALFFRKRLAAFRISAYKLFGLGESPGLSIDIFACAVEGRLRIGMGIKPGTSQREPEHDQQTYRGQGLDRPFDDLAKYCAPRSNRLLISRNRSRNS